MSHGPARGAGGSDHALIARARTLAIGLHDTLGHPRAFAVSADGTRLCYLRALSRSDRRQALWMCAAAGPPVLLVDPDDLGDEMTVPDAERARRERTREHASGITAYATTPQLDTITFVHNARLHVLSTDDGTIHALDLPGPVVDPRPSPTGTHVAWVASGGLHVARIDGGGARTLANDADPEITWGLAEFVAAEEMGRLRGFWWAPDGSAIAACRVDTTGVACWWLHEPVNPDALPRRLRYPAAGTANASVALAVLRLDGTRADVPWDGDALPYLAAVRWDPGTPLTLAVQSRDQRRVEILTASGDGADVTLRRSVTAEPWVELVPGTPRWTADGRISTVEDDVQTDTRRLMVDGVPCSPTGMHIAAVLGADADGLLVSASGADPTATGVWRLPCDEGEPEPLTPATGVHSAHAAGRTVVVHSEQADDAAVQTTVVRDGAVVTHLPQAPVDLPVRPRPVFATLGPAELRAALLLPSWYAEGQLPVLLTPYGGPHARRVRQAARSYLIDQWFAETGMAVLVVDGRGTPGRGLRWEHSVHGDLAVPALQDQARGLDAAARRWPMLDLDRVAIRGWSFGGYLAALAVLRRPDIFHAAIAGAPVADWRLYDTHYTERYLGHPDGQPQAYDGSSLLRDAAGLSRPLLLLHGMGDDNVVAAHSLRLSRALLAAGRPHAVLPLSATTHVSRDPVQQSSLLEIQLRFIRDALGLTSPARQPQ